jgi:hypothetical protein
VPIVELLRKHGSFEVAMLGKFSKMCCKAGVRDPDRLKALTVQAFTQQQQQQIQRKRR